MNAIKFMQSWIPDNQVRKIILVGGSYAGSLAVYFRQKFPHFVDAAIASSAPISWKYDFAGMQNFLQIGNK